jgi:hypothetical protein
VEDAAMFRTTDGGQNWEELSGLRGHGTGPSWAPGAGGMCLHTILLDPTNADRIFSPSRRGAIPLGRRQKIRKPINRGLKSQPSPDPEAGVGRCVHRRHEPHPARCAVHAETLDVIRSDNAR